MTILGLDGKPISEDEDCSWMPEALWHWMTNARTIHCLVRQQIFTIPKLHKIVNGLQVALKAGAQINPVLLRTCMLRVLSNRVVRIRIAAQILQREYENRRGYDILVEDYPKVLALWSKMAVLGRGGSADPGPRPELPEACPEPRTRKEVMRELIGIKTDLEERMGSLVERPF